jgi:hypothetical protein
MEILGESSFNNLFEARRDRLAKEAEAELLKAQAMSDMARQPAQKTSPLLYLIPIAGILVIGAVILIARKKRK